MSIAERVDLAEPEPAWEIARLFPPQGYWTEGEYLRLTDSTNWLVELTDGYIEVLAMPTEMHQLILLHLIDVMRSFVRPRKAGMVLMAPLRVRIRSGKFREPDLVFMRAANAHRRAKKYWESADLVMEIVSPEPESERRDYDEKKLDYAEGGIPEYWIIDPQQEKITVLTLEGGSYGVHGEFKPGEEASSVLLDGFAIDVQSVFEAGKER